MSQLDQQIIAGEQQNQGLNPRHFEDQNQQENINDQQQDNQNDDQQQKDYKQVLIKISDLQPQDQCSVISISNAAIEEIADMTNVFETQKYSKIAGIIKKELDQKFGEGWYVIVGKNFGTYVTHEKGSFMHFTFQDLHICVFRAR